MALRINTDWMDLKRNKTAQSGREMFFSGSNNMLERDKTKYFYKYEDIILF